MKALDLIPLFALVCPTKCVPGLNHHHNGNPRSALVRRESFSELRDAPVYAESIQYDHNAYFEISSNGGCGIEGGVFHERCICFKKKVGFCADLCDADSGCVAFVSWSGGCNVATTAACNPLCDKHEAGNRGEIKSSPHPNDYGKCYVKKASGVHKKKESTKALGALGACFLIFGACLCLMLGRSTQDTKKEGTRKFGLQPQPSVHTAAAKHALISARFDGGQRERIARSLHRELMNLGINSYMVARTHDSLTDNTGIENMYAMVAVCFDDYGVKTSNDSSTYSEVKFCIDKRIPIIPLKLCKSWPPDAKGLDGLRDPDGYMQNTLAFPQDRIGSDWSNKIWNAAACAREIAVFLDAYEPK